MKVCPRCGASNEDNARCCRECTQLLTEQGIEEYRRKMQEREDRELALEKRRRMVHNILVPTLGFLYLILYVFALRRHGMELFFPLTLLLTVMVVVGYLGIWHPEALFRARHFLSIDNLDDVELSNWYVISSRIGGILMLVFVFIGLLFLLFGT